MLSKRKKISLAVFTALLGLIQFSALLTAVIWFCPLSLSPWKDIIRQTAREQTGLNLQFNHGSIQLSRKVCVLHGLRASLSPDQQNAQQPHTLQFDRAEADFTINRQNGQWSVNVDQVQLYRPSRIILALTSDGFRMSPPLDQFTREVLNVQQSRQQSQTQSKSPLPTVMLSEASAALHIGEALETGALSGIANIEKLHATLNPEPGGAAQLVWHGRLNQQAVRGKWDLQPGLRPGAFQLDFDRVSLPIYVRGQHGFQTETTAASINGRFGLEQNDIIFDASMRAKRFEMEATATHYHLMENEPQFEGRLRIMPAQKNFAWSGMTYRSLETDLASSGALNIGDDGAFQLTMQARTNHANPQIAGLLAPQTGDKAQAVFEPGGYAALNCTIHRPANADVIAGAGSLEFNGIEARAPMLPRPVTGISGSLQFDEGRFRTENLRGAYGEGSVQATLTGDATLYKAMAGKMRLDFTGGAPVHQLMEEARNYARQQQANGAPAMPEITADGQIDVQGYIEAQWPDHPNPSDIQWISDVNLTLKNGRLEHSRLPAPIEGLHGALKFETDRLTIQELTGSQQGVELRVTGAVQGKDFFWQEPQIALKSELRLQVPEVLDAPLLRSIQDLKYFHPQGQASLWAEVSGPVLMPSQWQASSYLEFREFEFNPPIKWITQPIRGMSGRVELDGASIHVRELALELAGINITINGDAASEKCDFRIGIDGDAAGLQAMPVIFQQFDTAGRAKGELRLTLTQRGSAESAPSINLRSLKQIVQELSHLVEQGPPAYDWRLTGGLDVTDGVFTHGILPVPIQNISGRLEVDNTRLFFNNATGDIGASKDTVVSGEILIRQGDLPRMRFACKAPKVAIEDWIRNWRPNPPRSGYSFHDSFDVPQSWIEAYPALTGELPSEEDRQVEIEILIHGDSWTLDQLHGDDGVARVTVIGRQNDDSECWIDRCRVKGYSGSAQYWSHFRIPQDEHAQFEMKFIGDDLDLGPFLTDLKKKNDQTRGRLDIMSTLRGRFMEPESVRGAGHFNIKDSQFIGNVIFKAMRELEKAIPVLEDIRFASVNGRFEVEQKRVKLYDTQFNAAALLIDASGSCGFDHSLDLNLGVGLLLPGHNLPLINFIANTVGELKWARFHVAGTTTHPQVSLRLPFTEGTATGEALDSVMGGAGMMVNPLLQLFQSSETQLEQSAKPLQEIIHVTDPRKLLPGAEKEDSPTTSP